MEQFATEEQQVEAIKRFWKEHGTAIIVGALLGLGGLYGWRAYSDSQNEAKETASVGYQQVVENFGDEGTLAALDTFASENSDSGYGTIAGLLAAKQAVDEGNLEVAATQLQTVINNAQSAPLKGVAALRLSRVQIELNQLENALSTLSTITDTSFDAEVSELKGDVYVRQSKFDDARLAYASALENNANNRLLQMKLDNLAVAAGQ